jgi:hypothetical protein
VVLSLGQKAQFHFSRSIVVVGRRVASHRRPGILNENRDIFEFSSVGDGRDWIGYFFQQNARENPLDLKNL